MVAGRFSCGLTAALAAEVAAAGGGPAWFEQQVALTIPDAGADVADWWPQLHGDPVTLWGRQIAETESGHEVASLAVSREMVRRISSPTQVHEAMAEFWQNHLHVPATGDNYFMWRADYGEMIRRHALGRFDQMLAEAVLHPAMLIYLSAGVSTKTRPNENLGRELLELHTVGVGNHGEDDVKSCARVLTGYRIDMGKTWQPSYRPTDHWTGAVQVLDFRHANTSPAGEPVAQALLAHLARHPLTARRIATKLVRWFVADEPSEALVAHLASVYLAHDTEIVPVLRALVGSAELAASAGKKLRDPGQDVVAMHRVLGTTFRPPTAPRPAAQVIRQQASTIGMAPHQWPTPDGPPLTAGPWATPGRALASFRVHWAAANQYSPSDDVTYRSVAEWLPRLPMTVRAVVDHLSRELLVAETPEGLLDVVCWLTGSGPEEVVTANHRLVSRYWGQVLGTFLDHPSRFWR
ncbi:DUF1800 domain-containing protein [Nocardioides aquaticus]|uniref:DUF1800 domain-containing protein n=1 Tax=Nocardioides aquaticus TaxID=160826 RepID=UPI0031D88017